MTSHTRTRTRPRRVLRFLRGLLAVAATLGFFVALCALIVALCALIADKIDHGDDWIADGTVIETALDDRYTQEIDLVRERVFYGRSSRLEERLIIDGVDRPDCSLTTDEHGPALTCLPGITLTEDTSPGAVAD